jgi:UDP-glucose 4-epimerase
MDQPANQQILITGGAGFIGSHLTRRLAADNDVRVFDALTDGQQPTVPDDVDLIEADVRNQSAVTEACDGVDLVFHEAALVSVDASVEAPQKSHATNVQGTMNVLEAARHHDARVVLASSAAIYGHPDSVPVTERQAKTPTTPYGLDKLACDHYARLYHERYGLETVALRYFNVYGPGQTGGDYAGVISIFIERALADEPITVHGDGEQTRDFVFVDDIVAANRLAAETAATGECFNVGTGTSITIRELAERIRALSDSDSDIVHTEARDGDVRHSEANITKANKTLGYEPTVSIEEGLERTIDWFRNQRS